MFSRILFLQLCFLLLFTAACSKKTEITGSDFIPREDFVDMLVDLHLVDGITNDRKFYRMYKGVDSIDLLGPILEKYEVSKHTYDTTIYQYSRHPELFDQVYNEVMTKLNIMLDENDEEDRTDGDLNIPGM